MLSKNDITYNIPLQVKQLYNKYIHLAQFQLSYRFLLLIDYNNIQNLINEFNNHKDVLLMKKEYKNKTLNYKNALKKLNGTLYRDMSEIKKVNIDSITGLWTSNEINNTNMLQYFLPINGKLIDSNNLFFNVDKNKTEEINQLGFLNKWQYDILHTKDKNLYLNYLKVYLYINPLNLCRKTLKQQLLNVIKDLSYNDINIIKKYWLLSEFTQEDEYDIANIFSTKLLSTI